MRSERVSASSWSWVTNTKVMPTVRWSWRSSTACARAASCRARRAARRAAAPSGRQTSARASATRWRWPPESSCGRRAPSRAASPCARASLDPSARSSALPRLPLAQAVADVLRAHSDAGRSRSSGTPCWSAAALAGTPTIGWPSISELAGGRLARSPRACAAAWSCRSRRGPAGRRTRRAGCRARHRRSAVTGPNVLTRRTSMIEIMLSLDAMSPASMPVAGARRRGGSSSAVPSEHERGQQDQRAQSAGRWRQLGGKAQLAPDVDRQGLVGAAEEEGEDELVERDGEADQQAGDDARARPAGRVTRQKVIRPLSPRSSEASSRLLSKPSRRRDQHRASRTARRPGHGRA